MQAYAKLAGSNWTYYVKDLKVNIGRPPDPRPTTVGTDATSPAQPPVRDAPTVDIDLGPSKMVSRQHATIEYDIERTRTWQLLVTGRNGMRLDNDMIKKGTRKMLHSGQVLEIGGVQMMFVLPDVDYKIHPTIIRRLLNEGGEEFAYTGSTYGNSAPAGHASSSQVPVLGEAFDGDLPKKSGSALARGMVLESPENVDYADDSSRDIKPNISYALLIAQAILSSPDEQLTLNKIYEYIMDNYAFYRHTQTGWQVRHSPTLAY